MNYQVLRVRGDYPARQTQANDWGAQLYIEQHFNSKQNDREEDADNYSCVLVANNASKRSKELAAFYAKLASERLGLPNGGVVQVGYGRNGDGNLRHTDMPAILVEPLFVSDLSQAKLASSPEGQEKLARLIVDTVRHALPNGGKVALSVGHKGQDSKKDPGAPTANGLWEADLAEIVVARAAALLEAEEQPPDTQREGSATATRTDHAIGAEVMRGVMLEVLEPVHTKLDRSLKATDELAEKVELLVEDRKKDRADIDRILERLGMQTQ